MSTNYSEVVETAREYYNSEDADNFYFHVWGGEDIHIGIYDNPEISISQASHLTVKMMIDKLKGISNASRLLDIGSGYGGSARVIAQTTGAHVSCLNLSEVENQRNRARNEEMGLSDKIHVLDGDFENLPFDDLTFDFVWSQDAILHSGNRKRVLQEVHRVLKPGGLFIFTDPMQAHNADREELIPVLNRIHLDTMGSFEFYKDTAAELGMDCLEITDLSQNLPKHYQRVHDEIDNRYDEISKVCSTDYLERMKQGLQHWVKAGSHGNLTWGILLFQKK